MTAEGAHARALEAHTRRLLHEHAETVVPGDGLPLIRARVARRPWWRRALAYLTASKTAAPGASGTAAKPNDREESKDMSHDFIEESTPRGRQLKAALTLAHLIESGPPVLCTWRINEAGGLNGAVVESDRSARGDARARAGVAAFAEFLGVEMKRSQGRSEHSEWLTLSAVGEYRGREVTVWAHVDVRPISPYASFGGAR